MHLKYPQEILVHDWLNSSKVDTSKVDSTSNILITTCTEPKQSYSPNIIDVPIETTTTKVCFFLYTLFVMIK